MSVFHYQALADGFVIPSSPPAATPTGWEESPRRLFPASRTISHDDASTILRVPPLAPPFPEGWYAERFRLQPLSRTTTHDEQSSGTILRVPPLAPPFPEGWYSERFKLQPLARTTPHDEQSSSTLLRVPPLAPPFPEGWYAERAIIRPISRTTTHEEPASGTILRVPPLAPPFPEGWQPSDVKPARPSANIARDVPLIFQFIATPLSFPEGWQPSEIKPGRPSANVARDVPLIMRFVSPALPEGWYSERYRLPLPPTRQPADVGPGASTILSIPPLAPPFVEGWQAERFTLYPLARTTTHDEQSSSFFQLVPPPPPAPPPSPPQAPTPVAGGVVAPTPLPLAYAIDDDTEQAILLLWQRADVGDITPEVAVDDDTEQAVILMWGETVQFATLFKTLPRTGRQKSTQPAQDIQATGPYAVIDSKLAHTELIAADSQGSYGWNDYREVTITVYGLRKDIVAAVELILAVFNRRLGAPNRPTLTYPSGARFMRWWPIGNAVIEEDKDTKAGKDVWKATIRAEVWSVRDELAAPSLTGISGTAGDTFGAVQAEAGSDGLTGQFGDLDL